jgi:hypothetical protein
MREREAHIYRDESEEKAVRENEYKNLHRTYGAARGLSLLLYFSLSDKCLRKKQRTHQLHTITSFYTEPLAYKIYTLRSKHMVDYLLKNNECQILNSVSNLAFIVIKQYKHFNSSPQLVSVITKHLLITEQNMHFVRIYRNANKSKKCYLENQMHKY